MTDVVIAGAGSWGTALAHTLARSGVGVALWARDAATATALASGRHNPRYLTDIELDPAVTISADDAIVATGHVVILAVPTHGMRTIAMRLRPHIAADAVVVSAAKGFEVGTRMTMSAVLSDVVGPGHPVAAISGPNIAPEIALGLPAATVVACTDDGVAAEVRDLLNGAQLRVYSSADVVGVEFGGALKNIVAIAAGICDGIGAGDNGKAAIITRGLAEMARLGVGAGAQPITFAGLTGLGDCIVTCMSRHSRNRGLGEALAGGSTLAEAGGGAMVVEGVNATRVAVELAREAGVEMPIATEVHAVLFEGKAIAGALADLMARGAVAEARGLGLDDLRS